MWSLARLKEEEEAMAKSRLLLFVIGSQTRGLLRMLQAAEMISAGRQVSSLLCVCSMESFQTVAVTGGARSAICPA